MADAGGYWENLQVWLSGPIERKVFDKL